MKRGTRLIIKPINSSCGTRDRRLESGTVDKRDPDPDFPPEKRLAPRRRLQSTAPSAFPTSVERDRAIGSLPLCNRNYIYDVAPTHGYIDSDSSSPLPVSRSRPFPISRNSIYIYIFIRECKFRKDDFSRQLVSKWRSVN